LVGKPTGQWEAAFTSIIDVWRFDDLTTRLLRALLVPHAQDNGAIVLKPFWWRTHLHQEGALAGKIGSHEAHHRFGDLGRLPHLQVNVWRVGVKGSGQSLRVPYVSPMGVSWLVVRTLVLPTGRSGLRTNPRQAAA